MVIPALERQKQGCLCELSSSCMVRPYLTMFCIDVAAGPDFVFSLKKQLCGSAIVLGTRPLLSCCTLDAAFVVWSPSVRSGWCNGRGASFLLRQDFVLFSLVRYNSYIRVHSTRVSSFCVITNQLLSQSSYRRCHHPKRNPEFVAHFPFPPDPRSH